MNLNFEIHLNLNRLLHPGVYQVYITFVEQIGHSRGEQW